MVQFQWRRRQKQKKGLREKKSNSSVPISRLQAETFLARFQYPAMVSLNFQGQGDAIVSLGNKKQIRIYASSAATRTTPNSTGTPSPPAAI
ncbi:hypothetical protein ACQ86N_02150 [Puia sp. P3]|uniref:hypothetical protein n=1 Tax=Puia sp. P3 TaxID=3423952 RepID=UPI003D672FC0